MIELEGHADPRGSVDYNAKLADQRAEAVRNRLIELGTPPGRIAVTVYGELGDQREGLAENRRVELMPHKEPAIVGSR